MSCYSTACAKDIGGHQAMSTLQDDPQARRDVCFVFFEGGFTLQKLQKLLPATCIQKEIQKTAPTQLPLDVQEPFQRGGILHNAVTATVQNQVAVTDPPQNSTRCQKERGRIIRFQSCSNVALYDIHLEKQKHDLQNVGLVQIQRVFNVICTRLFVIFPIRNAASKIHNFVPTGAWGH